MAHQLTEIQGIDPTYLEQLATVGINTVDQLLAAGSNLKGIEQLVEATAINYQEMINLVQKADLFRIQGITISHLQLLQELNIKNSQDLSQQFPETLYDKLVHTHRQKQLKSQLPNLSLVRSWVAQAINYHSAHPEAVLEKPKNSQKKWSIDWAD
jgi:predicted RecB family nuclease